MSQTLEVPKIGSDHVEPQRKLSASRGVNLPDLKIIPVSSYQCESTFGTLTLGPTPPASASSSIVGKVVNFSTQNNKISPVPSGSDDRHARGLLELCVFLPNHSGRQYTVEGGRLATVTLLRNLLLSSLHLTNVEWFYEAFTLWMSSPLLVRKCWTDLLTKFVYPIDQESIESDEPLLILHRNVLLSRIRQQQICQDSDQAIDLLHSDAQEFILEGKYVCTTEQCLTLAALQMAIDWGPYNSDRHTPKYIRENLGDFLPDYVLHSVTSRTILGFSLPRCRGVENQLVQLYQENSGISAVDLKRKYLDVCLEIPSYGCATFTGQIEQKDMKLIKSGDLLVTVCINRDFLCVVDSFKKTMLLTVPIMEGLTWNKVDPAEPDNPDCLPSLFLHFPDRKVDGQSKLIQIFSKQVCMMNALLISVVDAPADIGKDPNKCIEPTANCFIISEDLCAATFDKEGNCLEVTGSLANCIEIKGKKSPKRH